MAFAANNIQQMNLCDSTFSLTERELKFLEKSWAKVFAEIVFPAIKEDDFAVLYSSLASRPNTPVNVIVGALILKEVFGITDDEMVEGLMFDIRYQYALHTTSFEEQPLSDRTLSRFRARCLAYETETGIDLIHKCITGLAKEISEFMQIAPNMQRMDSLMVSANIKNLSLLELFYTCVANLAKAMEKRQIKLPDAQSHYLEKDDLNRFIYHDRNRDITERTIQVMYDADELLKLCGGNLDDTSEYQLVIRLLKEQTTFDDDGPRRLRSKKEHENPSEALMNPADPEATFRKKANAKHIGYVGNIVEFVGDNGSIITDYAYERNIYSDSCFMQDYLSSQPVYESNAVLVADGAYSGEHNISLAKEHNIRLVTTNFTGKKPADIFASFLFNEEGTELLRCINGKQPHHTRYDKKNDRCKAYFALADCAECPYREQCSPREKKGFFFIELSWKTVNRAKQLRYMKTDEFRKLAHFRNGVESVPSLLRRRYHVDKIPAHGKKETRQYFGFKIGALNFQKLLKYCNSLKKCALNSKSA